MLIFYRSSGVFLMKPLEMLKIMSLVSQIVVAFVAIFGYFYTVVPIYQKEMMAEELVKNQAKLALVKNELEKSELYVNTNKKLIDDQNLKIKNLSKENLELKDESEKIANTIKYKNNEIESLNLEISKKEKTLKESKKILLSVYKRIFISQLKDRIVMLSCISFLNRPGSESYDIDLFNEYIKDCTPYNLIHKSLEDFKKRNTENDLLIPFEIRLKMISEFKNKLKKRSDLKASSSTREAFANIVRKKDEKMKNIPSEISKNDYIMQKHSIDRDYIEAKYAAFQELAKGN